MSEEDTREENAPLRPPKWLVTSSHGVWQVTLDSRCWVPYSVRHAREVGALQAACGQLVIGWELFWDIPFTADDLAACARCAELVASDTAKEDAGALKRWALKFVSPTTPPG